MHVGRNRAPRLLERLEVPSHAGKSTRTRRLEGAREKAGVTVDTVGAAGCRAAGHGKLMSVGIFLGGGGGDQLGVTKTSVTSRPL